MLVAEAAASAATDHPDVRRLPKNVQVEFLRAALLYLWERTKNKSVKFRVGPIPVSVKIAKLKPLIDWWLGSDGVEDTVG